MNNLFFTVNTNHYYNIYDYLICEAIKEKENIGYYELLIKLESKPRFQNIIQLANEIGKYMINSKMLQFVFIINSFVFSIIYSIGISRLIRGITYGKPIILILFTLVILTFVLVKHFYSVIKYYTNDGLTQFYYKELVPVLCKEKTGLDWDYFLFGSFSLCTILGDLETRNNPSVNTSGSGDSSGGSSCGSSSDGGSSCSSCGGCGGGGD